MDLCIEKHSPYDENQKLLKLAQSGDDEALERLCTINCRLVGAIAQRFVGRGCDYEDLMQIGSIGLLRAIRTFDEERGCAFSTYAVPLIMGEIRRFLRDDGLLKVSREQKRIGAMLLRRREEYISKNGTEPSISYLAEGVGVSVEEASLAIGAAGPVSMLSDPVFEDEGTSLENMLSDDGECERTFDKIALSDAIGRLPVLWRRIVICRYYCDMSQQKTAELLSLSQVKVSREEKKLLAFLRAQMQ